VVLAAIVVGLISWQRLSTIGDSWSTFSSTTLKQNAALMDAQVAMRDGIHHFKNYVLRGGDYDQKFLADMATLDKAIETYRAGGSLTADEERAIRNIQEGTRNYRLAVAEAARLRGAGQGIADIDHTVKGADKPITDAMAELTRIADKETADLSEEIRQTVASAAVTIGLACLGVVLVAAALAFAVTRSITRPLQAAMQIASRVATGDLTQQHLAARESRDEIGRLLGALRQMRDGLADTIRLVTSEAKRVHDSAGELSTAAQQVASSSDSQSQSTASAAAAVEQLTVSIDHVGSNADDASQRAIDAGKTADSGGNEVAAATRHIGEVATSVDATAGDIQNLTRQVQQIGGIATVIREVADQTNLLALNAAIEAARAGEQGRGFAVVADEVRKLAERTSNSVKEISNVIDAIRVGADSAVASMQRSRDVVDTVVSAAETAAASITGICIATENVRASIGEISSALREQRSASAELSRSVESIAQMSEENAAAVTQVAKTAQDLAAVSGSLSASISRFRV